ncbi:MAG: hypothetical protein IKZ53_03245 [Selenomonadaceae bacterium]|nr:hypothetical protein [Selenomonadaceae bacterium]
MLRKILICAMMLAALLVTGCGEEEILGSPDKAILTYAEIFMTGESEHLSAAGFTEDYQENIRKQMIEAFSESFKDIAPLNAESTAAVATKFYSRFKGEIKFQATIKKADEKNPVVEFVTTPPDQVAANRAAVSNDELIALIGMVGQLKADGATDEQLKENADVQKLAVSAIEKYIDNIPLQSEKTLDVTCEAVKGSDGKFRWAPKDLKVFKDFIRGQN